MALRPVLAPADSATVGIDLDDRERRELRRKTKAATLQAIRALGGEARRSAIRERALADGGFTPRSSPLPHRRRRRPNSIASWTSSWRGR